MLNNEHEIEVRVVGIVEYKKRWYQLDIKGIFYGIKDSERSLVRIERLGDETDVVIVVYNKDIEKIY